MLCPFMDCVQRLGSPLRASRPARACHDATRSAADVLSGHVLFEIEAIDRMHLNLYQPHHAACRNPRVRRLTGTPAIHNRHQLMDQRNSPSPFVLQRSNKTTR